MKLFTICSVNHLCDTVVRPICAHGKVDLRWVPDQRLSGPTQRLILGSDARRSPVRGGHLRPATFATRRNGQNGAVRSSGATIHVVARPTPIGAIPWLGTAAHYRSKPNTGGGSACSAPPLLTCSTIRWTPLGVPTCSSLFETVASWTGNS